MYTRRPSSRTKGELHPKKHSETLSGFLCFCFACADDSFELQALPMATKRQPRVRTTSLSCEGWILKNRANITDFHLITSPNKASLPNNH